MRIYIYVLKGDTQHPNGLFEVWNVNLFADDTFIFILKSRK